MLDIKFIRDNADLVKEGARKKHIEVDIDRLLELDEKRRELLAAVEGKRQEQNDANDAIASAADGEERDALIAKMKALKEELSQQEEELKGVLKDWQLLMVQVPNIPDVSVPEGESDAENQEIKQGGNKQSFSFESKNHVELMTSLGMLDLERGTKVSGFRGYFLKGDGARLAFALWRFVEDTFAKKDFTPMIAPALANRELFLGTGYLPQGEDDLYQTQDGQYLAGTAEVPLMGYYMDDVIEAKELPVKLFGFSPCYRREAGSHGKDTKGVFRVHEFFKFEQVVLCEASHETSVALHEELNRNVEELVEALDIPYRIVINAGGDLGLGQVKKYDIELWVPSEQTYREISSASYFHDFQTRRLNIRYRGSDGKLRFAHSLNSTAMPTPRMLVALVENYQQEDGSIRVPKALQPYIGKETIEA